MRKIKKKFTADDVMLGGMDRKGLEGVRKLMENQLGKPVTIDEVIYSITMSLINEFASNKYTPDVVEEISEALYDAAVYAREHNKPLVNFEDAMIDAMESGNPVPKPWLVPLDSANAAAAEEMGLTSTGRIVH